MPRARDTTSVAEEGSEYNESLDNAIPNSESTASRPSVNTMYESGSANEHPSDTSSADEVKHEHGSPNPTNRTPEQHTKRENTPPVPTARDSEYVNAVKGVESAKQAIESFEKDLEELAEAEQVLHTEIEKLKEMIDVREAKLKTIKKKRGDKNAGLKSAKYMHAHHKGVAQKTIGTGCHPINLTG